MGDLSTKAKSYILSVVVIGTGLLIWHLVRYTANQWVPVLIIAVIATILQVLKIEGSTARSSYNLSWVTYGFTFTLLGPTEAIFVITIAHLIEWIWHKYLWYIQLFNIAGFALVTSIAGFTYIIIETVVGQSSFGMVLAVMVSLAVFTFLNHLAVGLVILVARGQSLTQSGIFGALTLTLDLGLLCLGAAAAILWQINPFAIALVLFLAYLLYAALQVPALQRQAETDPKTSLFNARYFAEQIEEELSRAQRFQRPLTIVMADLDLLRVINNTYGHLAGDAVLIGISKILQESVRDYDMVSRFGGEEFAILLPETKADDAYWMVEEIRQKIEKAEFVVPTSVKPIHATMSFGIAERNPEDPNETVDALIHNADIVLYKAKEGGRNRSYVYAGNVTEEELPSRVSAVTSSLKARLEAESLDEGVSLPQAASMQSPPSDPIIIEEPNPIEQEGVKRVVTTLPAPWKIEALVIGLTVTAAFLIVILMQSDPSINLVGLLGFVAIVALVEGMSIDIYVRDTSISTSAAPLITGVILFGPIGAIILGGTIAIVAWLKTRSPLQRFLFNTSNHMTGGLLGAAFLAWTNISPTDLNIYWQLFICGLLIMILYISTTYLLAAAVGLSNGLSIQGVWVERFRWLAPYYLALGMVAYTLLFSYQTIGFLGLLAVLAPLYMLRFSQLQYIDHTQALVNQLRASNKELKLQADEINLLTEDLLLTLAQSIDLRDPYVMEHSKHVARYATLVAQQLDLPLERVENIRKAGLLHDIGKLGVPERILYKDQSLTDEEYEIIKQHVNIGADLIHGCHSLQPLTPFIRYHHERFDGHGYPEQLAQDDIPLEARILCLADAVEAMASDRPYRQAMEANTILIEVQRHAGTHFDPMIVDAFRAIVEQFGEAVIVNSARNVRSQVS